MDKHGKTHPLNIFYTNASGLINKLDELKIILSKSPDIDIICISETHLNSDILDSELNINGYEFFRKDRDFDIELESANDPTDVSGGGGSIIYFKESIHVLLDDDFYKIAPDSLAVKLISDMGEIYIACIYRSMNLSKSKNNELLSCLTKLCNEKNVFETLLVGDFNLPDISWENCGLKGIKCYSTTNKVLLQQLEFFDMFNEKGLNWYLTNEITRRRMVNGVLQESLLDQVLFTNDKLVSNVTLTSPLGKSDHVSMNIELGISLCKTSVKSNKKAIKKHVWSKISPESILEFSRDNIDWNFSNTDLSPEEKLNELDGKFKEIAVTVPTSRFDSSNRPLNLPWSNSTLKRLHRNKDKTWNEFYSCPNLENFNYAMTKDDIYNKEQYKLKSNYEKKLTNNLKKILRAFMVILGIKVN